ncbi:MAG: hypothetical protein FD180_1674 [Planctomycetota bacterium]|nr:MAG: hypothetical protein FD180_1674 [Planctomycetota bacterium]
MRCALAAAALFGFALPCTADPDKAVQLCNEAAAAFAANDFETAERKFSEAIKEDSREPDVAVLYGNRGMARGKLGRNVPALEDLGRALDVLRRLRISDPEASRDWMMFRCMILTQLSRWQEALDGIEEVLKLCPGDTEALRVRAWAHANLGRVDESLKDLKAQMVSDPYVAGFLVDVQFLQGDFEGVLATCEEGVRRDAYVDQMMRYRVMAECELGRLDDALKHVRVLQDRAYTPEIPFAQYYLLSTPGYFKYNFAESTRLLNELEARTDLILALQFHGRLLFLAEHFVECRDLLSTHAPRSDFLCLFWLGAAQWKLEQFVEARATLTDARRLNPYITAWAKRFPGLDAFLAPIDETITAEKGGDTGRRLRYELATHLLSVAEIETLVRRYEFARAAGEYGKLLPSLVSPVRKKEVETRLAEVKGMAAALDKLVLAINAKKVKLNVKVAGQDLALVKSDNRAFEFTFSKGSGKFPWAYLDPLDFFRFANPQATTPEEHFALGVLLWDVGEAKAAQQNIENASKGAANLKGTIDNLVARKRGVAAPKGGFVLYKGTYVTPEEKTNLEKGLVRYQGKWATPADKEKLAKGLIQVGGKWVDGEEAKLLAAGYRKYKDQWMGAEEYEALRSKWDTANEVETEHFKIRTNAGEGFSKDLAALAEVAYGELKTFYDGREPKLGKEKMTLFAFRAYEDYRRYCVEKKAEEHLNAAGFASSDSNVVVGWNKTGSLWQLLQTMTHEAAHLFYFRICSPSSIPSWHAEGMATYFEGFKGAGASWKFNYISESRLAFAREAMLDKKQISLAELMAADALKLINSDASKANLFYSECWALNYFLSQTDNAAYRDGYKAFRKAVETGKPEALSKFIPDQEKLEKDWTVFITSQ